MSTKNVLFHHNHIHAEAIMMPSRRHEIIERLDDILKTIIQADLAKNAIIISFGRSTTEADLESFIRSFYLRIEDENARVKIGSEPLIIIRGRIKINGSNQMIIGLPENSIPPVRKGDQARLYLFGKRGKAFPL